MSLNNYSLKNIYLLKLIRISIFFFVLTLLLFWIATENGWEFFPKTALILSALFIIFFIRTYQLFNPVFKGIEFKVDEHHEHTFTRMHVRPKAELVHSGLRDPNYINPIKETGKKLNGEAFLKLKESDEDVVILDVRSNYETRLGKFKNSITLDIENFREFPQKLAELEHLKDKKVVTCCTGGIKCEKASALLLKEGFKDVYQLHNGIIGYAKDTGGKDFDGVLYVFDGRVAVPINEVNPTAIAQCAKCDKPTTRNLNCANVECNEQFNMCEACSEEMEGACSDACKVHPRKRPYNGTGYYTRPPVENLMNI